MGRDGDRRHRENLFQPPGDARLVQVVGRHFHAHAVADSEPDPAFAHLATDGGEDEVLVVQFDPEHGAGQHGLDAPFYFNVFFFHDGQTDGTENKKGGVRFEPNPARGKS